MFTFDTQVYKSLAANQRSLERIQNVVHQHVDARRRLPAADANVKREQLGPQVGNIVVTRATDQQFTQSVADDGNFRSLVVGLENLSGANQLIFPHAIPRKNIENCINSIVPHIPRVIKDASIVFCGCLLIMCGPILSALGLLRG
jgi:hypothetical protein